MRKIKSPEFSRSRKNIAWIIALALLASLGLLVAYFFFIHPNNPPNTNSNEQPSTSLPDDTATKERGASNNQPETSNDHNGSGTKTDTDANTTNQSSPPQSTQVVIVDASQYGTTFEVRAYAVAPENGTCTFVFSGPSTLTKQSTATPGPTTSPCKTVDVPTSEFSSKGAWKLTVTYESASGNYKGSLSKDITIQ